MPPGEHEISATLDGEPKRVTVRVDEAACQRLQADLEKQLAAYEAGEKARPVLMFDHNKNGNAAATPIAFEWDSERGIILRVEWTQAGRDAVEGGNYGYISPAFLADANGNITGLVGGVEIGSLVNDPAFEKNACILASNTNLPPLAELEKNESMSDNDNIAQDGESNQTNNKEMEEIKKLLGLPAEADEAAVLDAIKALMDKAAAAEASKKELEEVKASNADAFVKRLTESGTIAPHDSARIEAARALHIENAQRAELVFSGMKSDTVPPAGSVVHAGKTETTRSMTDLINDELKKLN